MWVSDTDVRGQGVRGNTGSLIKHDVITQTHTNTNCPVAGLCPDNVALPTRWPACKIQEADRIRKDPPQSPPLMSLASGTTVLPTCRPNSKAEAEAGCGGSEGGGGGVLYIWNSVPKCLI